MGGDEVLGMIRQSPQMAASGRSPEQWSDYADRWGVAGNFRRIDMPVAELVRLIRQNYCRLSSSLSQADIEAKMAAKQYNAVILTKARQGGYPLAILDGSHSLVAAHRAGVVTLPVLVSDEAARYLGLGG